MKKYVVVIIALLVLLVWLFSSSELSGESRQWADTIDKDFSAYSMLEELCTRIGGRLSGSKEGRMVEDFILKKLNEFGYTNAYGDSFNHQGWQREDCSLRVTSPVKLEIPSLALGLTPAYADVNAKIIDAGMGYKIDFEKIGSDKVKDKIVLIDMKNRSGERHIHRTERIKIAREYGAAGVIIINVNHGNLLLAGNSTFFEVLNIPALSISYENGSELKEIIKKHKDVTVSIKMSNKLFGAISRNIVLEIPGKINNEIILVGAQADAWDIGQGATDNGIGVCTLLEIARHFKKQNFKPYRSLKLIWFMGEELGLMGSFAYVEKHKSELKNILQMINLDEVDNPIGFNLIMNSGRKEWFENLAKKLKPLGMQNIVVQKPLLNSDHVPFMLNGIAILTFLSKQNYEIQRNYHSRGDRIELVSKEHLKNTVKIIGLTIRELANDTSIKKVRLTPGQVKKKIIELNLEDALRLENLWHFN